MLQFWNWQKNKSEASVSNCVKTVEECACSELMFRKMKQEKKKAIKHEIQPVVRNWPDIITIVIMNNTISVYFGITVFKDFSGMTACECGSGWFQASDEGPHTTLSMWLGLLWKLLKQSGRRICPCFACWREFLRLSSMFVLLGWSVHQREVWPAGTMRGWEAWLEGALDCLWIGTLWDYILVEKAALCTRRCEVTHSSTCNGSCDHPQPLTHNSEQAMSRVCRHFLTENTKRERETKLHLSLQPSWLHFVLYGLKKRR